MKEYYLKVKIDGDTILIASLKNSWKASEVYDRILNGIPNAYRGGQSLMDTIGDYFLTLVIVEGGDLIYLLSKVREDLERVLKLKPEEVKLALTNISIKEPYRQIF